MGVVLGATQAQSAWPHTNDPHLVNTRAILLIFVALDSPFHELHNNAIVWCITMVGHLVAHVSLGVGRYDCFMVHTEVLRDSS